MALAGTPQALAGTGTVRDVPAEIYGPPKVPFGLRVSMTRHGASPPLAAVGFSPSICCRVLFVILPVSVGVHFVIAIEREGTF